MGYKRRAILQEGLGWQYLMVGNKKIAGIWATAKVAQESVGFHVSLWDPTAPVTPAVIGYFKVFEVK